MDSQAQKQNYNKETQKQRNIKYRRKKNFIKKGFQFSKVCGVDIIILTLDKNQNKFHEYYTSPQFKFDEAKQIIENGITEQNRKIKIVSVNARAVFEKQYPIEYGDDTQIQSSNEKDSKTNLLETIEEL